MTDMSSVNQVAVPLPQQFLISQDTNLHAGCLSKTVMGHNKIALATSRFTYI